MSSLPLRSWKLLRSPPPQLRAALSQLDCSCSGSEALPSSCRVTLANACLLLFSFLWGLKGEGVGQLSHLLRGSYVILPETV